jgi:hypothetical protein
MLQINSNQAKHWITIESISMLPELPKHHFYIDISPIETVILHFRSDDSTIKEFYHLQQPH